MDAERAYLGGPIAGPEDLGIHEGYTPARSVPEEVWQEGTRLVTCTYCDETAWELGEAFERRGAIVGHENEIGTYARYVKCLGCGAVFVLDYNA